MAPRVGVILASVREGRKGAVVAEWVLRHAEERAADYELIDLQDHPPPHFAEPWPPMTGRYRDRSTLDWAAMADVGPQVQLSALADIGRDGVVENPRTLQQLQDMLGAVEAWSAAPAPLQAGSPA